MKKTVLGKLLKNREKMHKKNENIVKKEQKNDKKPVKIGKSGDK